VTRARCGRPWSALGLGAAVLASIACGATRGTERVINGRTVQGRYIEPEAYAAYAEGVYREAHGEWNGAELAYRRALLRDGQSPQILTRLAVLACRQSLPRALRQFERAIAVEDYAPAWSERAECLSTQHQPAPAVQAALRAVALDPRGARSNLLLTRLYREQAQRERARAWLFAWLLLEPDLGDWAQALRRECALLGDVQLSALAEHELARRVEYDVSEGQTATRPKQAPVTAELIAALRAGELEHARQLAAEASVPPLQLSLLATESAQPELGLAQAELLIAANPGDPGALVAGLLAAALSDDEPAFRRLLNRAQAHTRPSAELAHLLTNLLRIRVGDEAAERWRDAYRATSAVPGKPPP
jgi:hypothetical protein